MNPIKLFCFPYAGGSSVIFKNWQRYLDPGIEVRAIELKSRGKRIHEPLYNDLAELVDDVFNLVKNEITQSPYSLFGHSMGSVIAYELAQKTRDNNLPQPMHVFFSGGSAPHVKRKNKRIYHLMEDDEFKREVLKLGGTPAELFEHPELLELFLPLLKSDFKMAESPEYGRHIRPLDTGITVFSGKADNLTPEQCEGWRIHTTQNCSIHYFEGGHFFLHTEHEQIMRIINAALLQDYATH